MHYRINTPTIAHERLDDDVIVINFETGAYYSLRGTATTIWEWIDGSAVDVLLAKAGTHFSGAAETIRQAIHDFLARLEEERLIVPLEPPEEAEILQNGEARIHAETSSLMPFSVPVLDAFKDVQALLMIYGI